MCVCVFVHSYLWSSTSNRRKSGGWGSSLTRGTCASHSWSWRLRTWKTLSHRTCFETQPTCKVTLTSSWEHMSHCTKKKKTRFKPPHCSRGPDTLLIPPWAHSLHRGVFKPPPHVFLSVSLSVPQRTHMLFVIVHTLEHWVSPSCNMF